MDGGRRLLRQIAGAKAPGSTSHGPRLRGEPRRRKGPRLFRFLAKSRIDHGFVLALFVMGVAGGAGFWLGGGYESFVRDYGAPRDIAAKVAGFSIEAVTITGQKELDEREILQAAGITPKNSLVFLDAVQVRDRLKSVPLVREASVRKLFPNRLLIEVTEREPFALWQREGDVHLIAADGTVIDAMQDDRFIDLPFVAGEGANKRAAEFVDLLEAAGELRQKIRAGVLVSERRWNLKLANGVDVRLPEKNPKAALKTLEQAEREQRITQKDILAIDLRHPGRIVVRLGVDAYTARVEAQSKKPGKAKGSET